jgi:hypothetical protein
MAERTAIREWISPGGVDLVPDLLPKPLTEASIYSSRGSITGSSSDAPGTSLAWPIHPSVERISGLAPSDVDARALYHDHLLGKHG